MAIFRSLFIALTIFFVLASSDSVQGNDCREPVWAGRFYPADINALTADLDRLCSEARQDSFARPAGKSLRALILPHAGYIYSGPTAAHAALVLDKKQFDKVILLGPDHQVGYKSAAISDVSSYRTPLGKIPLHADARRLLRQTELFRPIPEGYDAEHSLEVNLPFLQYLLGNFALVPIVLGSAQPAPIAAALAPLLTPRTLVVVSSDLSHHLPYDLAMGKDKQTINHILNLDGQALASSENSACGLVPLQVLINLARRHNWQPVLIHYANSGDTAGSHDKVVGYAAIAFYGDITMDKQNTSSSAINAEQGRILLTLARQTIALKLGLTVPEDERKKLETELRDPVLQQERGTFVTLHKHRQLRGCIGSIAAEESLAANIRHNAVNSAFGDPRFPPLQKKEFDEVDIEVSILTEPQPLTYDKGTDLPTILRPKIDGVILRDGMAGATFLPQVWDQLPQPEDFLSRLCMKAGLRPNAWQTGKLEVLTYQVQYFSE
ncbi:MAG: AmmeMemoRadiSam system protein B [Proteobacteria bacterium]|nr:AmmeMemoRadiSam system protein B [Pseudomonadota bacterium]